MNIESLRYSEWIQENNLRQCVIEAFENNESLFELLQDMNFIQHETLSDFINYINLSWETLDKWKKNALLIYSSFWEIIIAGDWSVDRIQEAEKCLWLRRNGFDTMQWVLADKYGWEEPVHLHKWFGDGTLMQRLSMQSRSTGSGWIQKWIADKVYFSLESILNQFLYEPNHKWSVHDEELYKQYQKSFLWALAAGMKKSLKDAWFTSVEWAALWSWKPRGEFRDVNEVYSIVEQLRVNPRDPKHHFSEVYNETTWKFTVSVDFESDTRKMESRGLEYLIQRFLQKDHQQALEEINKHKHKYQQQEEKRLQRVLSCIEEERYDEIAGDLAPILQSQWVKVYKQATVVQKKWAANKLKELTNWELENLYYATGDLEKICAMFSRFSQQDKDRFLWNFLNKDFLSRDHQPNLNEYATAFTDNATIGMFTDIPEVYWKQSVNLITATRSDSHENDTDFESDLRWNLEVLKPGWVLFTDGTRQSFSRIERFDIIQNIVQGRDDVEVTVVCDMLWNPVSCMIQKKHPEGYLTEDEKYEFISWEFQFRTLTEILTDKKISIDRQLRREVLALGEWVDIFNGILPYFKKAVSGILDKNHPQKTIEHYKKALARLSAMPKKVLN